LARPPIGASMHRNLVPLTVFVLTVAVKARQAAALDQDANSHEGRPQLGEWTVVGQDLSLRRLLTH
jgi:hypothetical protein